MEETEFMNYLFKDMRTMCWAIVALIILLVSSCKDDDDVVSGFLLIRQKCSS